MATIFSRLSLLLLYLSNAQSYLITIDAFSEECFFEDVRERTTVTVTFEVVEGGFLDIDVLAEGPRHKKIYEGERRTADRIKFYADDPGRYHYCFGNRMSTLSPKTVMFDVVVDRPEPPTDEDGDLIDSAVKEISDSLNGVYLEQLYMETRDSVHRSINENTNSRVLLWSVFEVAVLVSVCIVQVYYLKKYFEITASV